MLVDRPSPSTGSTARQDRGELQDRVRALRLPREPVTARRGSRLAWALCIFFAATTAVLAYRQWLGTAAPDPSAPAPSPAANAQVVAPEPTAGSVVLESKGYIIPARQILVSPKVSGMIVRLSLVEGQRVQQGDVLAELEDIDYRAEADRAAAALEAAKHRYDELQHGFRPEEIEQVRAELAEARTQAAQLNSEWKRRKTLLEQKTLTQEEYDLAESQAIAAERRVDRLTLALTLVEQGPRREKIAAAAAEVRQAEAEVAKAQWRLDNCLIRAPISGTILKKNAEEGNIVNPIAFNGSFSLCEMADLANLEVELSIQERDISRIFAGQKCAVRAEAYPDRVYQAVVSRLMPIADRAKGAVPVRVKVAVPQEEEGVYLKPEMGAVVTFYRAGGEGTRSSAN